MRGCVGEHAIQSYMCVNVLHSLTLAGAVLRLLLMPG